MTVLSLSVLKACISGILANIDIQPIQKAIEAASSRAPCPGSSGLALPPSPVTRHHLVNLMTILPLSVLPDSKPLQI